jgi:hypothetical protein
MATRVFRDSEMFSDGTFYRVVAYVVEPDEHFVEGVKYSFQYCDSDGENILRYDNARHPGTDVPRHHKHVGADETTEPVEYTGNPVSHREKFENEMKEIRK